MPSGACGAELGQAELNRAELRGWVPSSLVRCKGAIEVLEVGDWTAAETKTPATLAGVRGFGVKR